MHRQSHFLLALIFLVAFGVRSESADKLEYNRDIRPILYDQCFACHGPDSAARKADLRLDKRDAAIEMKAIVPGKPEASGVIERIFSTDPDEVMPPGIKKKLTAQQKETLRRWVAEGAEYEPHWSFIVPAKANPPAVKKADWVRNPLDQFVLRKLEERGLAPAPEADRRTLARRVSLDLTGLPPAPELVAAFVADQSSQAYENFVDRLLESKHWGEHRGRYWLDAARYADTHGIHFDNFREIWAYRDWVINAFNRNLPFDQFTIEQLAGDLLPNRTLDQQIASGFNRCNITTNEGGTIPEEYLVLYTRDRTETASQVWLGLTANCSECHDHKFDPLTQREFYEMAAFFNNTTQNAMDGNIKDTPPIVQVPRIDDVNRWQSLQGEIAAAKQKLDVHKQTVRGEFDKWLATAKPEDLTGKSPTAGLVLHAPFNEGSGPSTKIAFGGESRDVTLTSAATWDDGFLRAKNGAALELADAGDFEARQPFSVATWVKLPAANLTGAIVARMEPGPGYRGWDLWVQQNKVGMHLISAWQADALKVVGTTALKPGEWTHVAVTYDGSTKAAGLQVFINGPLQKTTVEADTLKGDTTTRATVPLKIGTRHASEPLKNITVQDLRLYERTLVQGEIDSLAKSSRLTAVIVKPADKRTEAEKNDLFTWWLVTNDKTYQELNAPLAKLEREAASIKTTGTIAHVMQEKPSEAMAFVLFRGEYDKRRDPVKPDTPDCLPPMPPDLPKNRLGFAQWLLRPEHPLTTRVTVNRFWQEVFGTGLVRTAGDFGVAGELPSNQELLDWLAVDFRESNWDVKRFFKMLVTSATYRQAAITTKDKLEKDPQNRLLSRGPRFRRSNMARPPPCRAGAPWR